MQLTVRRHAIIYHEAPISENDWYDWQLCPGDLKATVMPIFPLRTFITIKGYSVWWQQGVQRSILTSAILDLKDDFKPRYEDRLEISALDILFIRLRWQSGLHFDLVLILIY
jgi:hypothetical protein